MLRSTLPAPDKVKQHQEAAAIWAEEAWRLDLKKCYVKDKQPPAATRRASMLHLSDEHTNWAKSKGETPGFCMATLLKELVSTVHPGSTNKPLTTQK